MAKETAKKNLKKNMARMRAFSMITAALNCVYVFVILYRNGGLPSFRDLMAISFWAGQEYMAYTTLNKLAQPTIGSDGALLDCIDVSNPQELGHYTFVQDVLWVCWVVQTLCILHPAFIVFYLPVPATLIYKLWGTLLKPLVSAYLGGSAADTGVANGIDGSSGNSSVSRQERRNEALKQRKAARRGQSSTE